MNLIDLMEISTMYTEDENYHWMWKDIVLDSRVNKDVLLTEIDSKCGQMIPISLTVATFKELTEAFFLKWSYQITKLLNTQEFDYNPIWNRDGMIKELRHINRQNERQREENVTEDVDTKDSETASATDENTVSAYNSSTYQPYDKTVSNSSRDASETLDRDRDTNENESETEATAEDFIQTNQGNVGVTTTQSMIQEERALYEFNIYNWIIEKYSQECFLRIW